MEQSFGGGKPRVFEATEAFSSSGAELSEYARAYVSEEIGNKRGSKEGLKRRTVNSHTLQEGGLRHAQPT